MANTSDELFFSFGVLPEMNGKRGTLAANGLDTKTGRRQFLGGVNVSFQDNPFAATPTQGDGGIITVEHSTGVWKILQGDAGIIQQLANDGLCTIISGLPPPQT